jgi:drug/metabolite transporter (DMT)-like permease
MTVASLALILLSACVHVVAHVALKRSSSRAAFAWWMLLGGAVLFSPLLMTPWPSLPPVVWAVAALSAGLEALYFTAIARAYETGDLSLVYPLARGTAPVLLLCWSVLFAGEQPSGAGALGVGIIAAGLYLINLPRLGAWAAPMRALSQPGPRWALAAGLCTSLYTVLDRYVLRAVTGTPTTWPLLYTYLELALALLLLSPWTLRAVGRPALQREWRANRGWAVVAGATTLGAYALVLYAIRAGTPASYAGAVRETSVVLGALLGFFAFKEPRTPMRLAGAVAVAAGVAVIAVWG